MRSSYYETNSNKNFIVLKIFIIRLFNPSEGRIEWSNWCKEIGLAKVCSLVFVCRNSGLHFLHDEVSEIGKGLGWAGFLFIE